MYSNDYDDGALMNSYIRWSKRLARLHQRTLRIYRENELMHRNDEEESETVKADEEFCARCKGEEDENAATFPHIQDLCPADRRRIAQLVKQLMKCTKETRDCKSELIVSESEKEAMRTQYQKSLDRREAEVKQLEFQLHEARTESNEMKTRVSRMLELLTRQIAAQEKQFLGLTETVRDLVREKSHLQDTLEQKQMESDAVKSKFQRTKELLEAERLERSENSTGMVHRACQTEEIEIVDSCKRTLSEESNKDSVSGGSQNLKIKSKEDLEEPSTDGTLIRELFFRKPSIEENGTLDIIPVLSDIQPRVQRQHSSFMPAMYKRRIVRVFAKDKHTNRCVTFLEIVNN